MGGGGVGPFRLQKRFLSGAVLRGRPLVFGWIPAFAGMTVGGKAGVGLGQVGLGMMTFTPSLTLPLVGGGDFVLRPPFEYAILGKGKNLESLPLLTSFVPKDFRPFALLRVTFQYAQGVVLNSSWLAVLYSVATEGDGCPVATSAEQVDAIFNDARALYADALEMLDGGKLRNAAEKAWGATKRATDAFLLARTGELPRTSERADRRLFELARRDDAVKLLQLQYDHRQRQLHGRCFCNGDCEPAEGMADLILGTAGYIEDAEGLA